MDEAEKQAITDLMPYLKENTTATKEILADLWSKRKLTEDELASISSIPEPSSQLFTLYTTIMKKRAWDDLLEALKKSLNVHIANLLQARKDEIQAQTPADEDAASETLPRGPETPDTSIQDHHLQETLTADSPQTRNTVVLNARERSGIFHNRRPAGNLSEHRQPDESPLIETTQFNPMQSENNNKLRLGYRSLPAFLLLVLVILLVMLVLGCLILLIYLSAPCPSPKPQISNDTSWATATTKETTVSTSLTETTESIKTDDNHAEITSSEGQTHASKAFISIQLNSTFIAPEVAATISNLSHHLAVTITSVGIVDWIRLSIPQPNNIYYLEFCGCFTEQHVTRVLSLMQNLTSLHLGPHCSSFKFSGDWLSSNISPTVHNNLTTLSIQVTDDYPAFYKYFADVVKFPNLREVVFTDTLISVTNAPLVDKFIENHDAELTSLIFKNLILCDDCQLFKLSPVFPFLEKTQLNYCHPNQRSAINTNINLSRGSPIMSSFQSNVPCCPTAISTLKKAWKNLDAESSKVCDPWNTCELDQYAT